MTRNNTCKTFANVNEQLKTKDKVVPNTSHIHSLSGTCRKHTNQPCKPNLRQEPSGHPFRPEIKNDMRLSSRELDRLKASDVVVKNERGKSCLVQLDPATNELCKIRTEHIVIPDRLAKTPLSEKIKTELLNGKVVSLRDPSGNNISLKIDLLHPRGYSTSTTLDKHMGTSPSRDTHQSPSEEKTISRTPGIKIGR